MQPAYRITRIPKIKDGRFCGFRVIEAPNPELKARQRLLLKIFQEVPLHSCTHGVRGTSTSTNATPHIGNSIIIKLDISNFFPETTRAMIERGLRVLDHSKYAELLDDCLLEERLPQGAPTSPMLSAIAFSYYDYFLQVLADEHGLTYTRYVDDLTFSGPYRPRRFVGRVRETVLPYRIHPGKIESCHRAYQRQEVTGIVINEKKSVPRKYRKLLRAKLDHFARRNEPLDDSTQGELSYVCSINGDQYENLRKHYEKRCEFYRRRSASDSEQTG